MSNVTIDPGYCGWDTTYLLVFSENVFGNFIYYSHLFPAITILILGVFLLWQNRTHPANRSLFFLALMFSIWSYIDLILWATEKPEFTMFFWSILIYFDVLIYVSAVYFVYAFIRGTYPPIWGEVIVFVMMMPVFVLAHTSANLTGYDYTNCYREALEGPLWQYYVYGIEILMSAWILLYGWYSAMREADRKKKRMISLLTIGTFGFLVSFSIGNILGSFGVDWEIGQHGLFSMPLFAAVLVYLIIRYQSLNAKLFSAQALIAGIFLMVVSLLFLRSTENIRLVTLITAPVILLLGFLLVRSVKREIEQRELAQSLATKLAGANARLERLDKMKSEFVSIASHQLRSPLTSIRGYVSMILEGSYGALDDKTKEVLTRVSDSARHMALSIDDFLNVSRIEAGNMKYDLIDADVRKLVEDIVADMKPVSAERGIPIELSVGFEGSALSKIDVGKTRQIIQNLIDNAFKYNKGDALIEVVVHKDDAAKRIQIYVKDQGIGLSKESIQNLFGKFARAENASTTNVSGSGLGLYIARTMAREMGGDITVTSPGEGQGSTFTVTLPLNGIASSWNNKG